MTKTGLDIEEIKKDLSKKYKDLDIYSVVPNEDGSVSILLGGEKGRIDNILKRLNSPNYEELPQIDKSDVSKLIFKRKETASTVRRDTLSEGYLDLKVTPTILAAKPQDLYKRSMDYYKTEDVYGSSIDILTNLAAKGFKNVIADKNIRNFYDNWIADTEVDLLVEQLFFEYFRSGFVRTYKVLGKYIPKINYVSPIPGEETKKVSEEEAKKFLSLFEANKKVFGAKKKKWSKEYIPIKYTILNPTLVEIEKGSILSGQQFIYLKSEALKDVKVLLETPPSELTEHQVAILDGLSPEMKNAALKGEDFLLDPYLIGAIDYRRQPYELYPIPRGVRAFESMEYKRALRQADYSTLDGVTNFLLVVTIGNDTFPVKSQDQLETVAELFNTTSKSFNVVWDHTLKVQRVEPTMVGEILGQDKYKQVNDDITGAFGVIRALIDGVGNPSKAAADLAVKAVAEEIYAARRQISRWIYREYRDVAEAMSFERYPKVTFDNMVLKDEILMMNVIQGMLDRRIMSYKTGHEQLGLDSETEKEQMSQEKNSVLDGTFGILGSPYNSKALPAVQDTQRTPTGTPSEGRPKGKPAKTPGPPTKPGKPKADKEELVASSFGKIIDNMSEDDMLCLLNFIKSKLTERLE